jgi:hypothetical protein
VKRLFRKIDPAVLRCRTKGHRWNDVSDLEVWVHKVKYLKGFRETSQCDVCETLREEVWSEATGSLMCRYYRYPKGYHIGQVDLPEGVTMREAMRAEWSTRQKAGQVKRERAAHLERLSA